MVDMILNTIREFIEPLPIWEVRYGSATVRHIPAANANIAKRAYAKAYGLKSVRLLSVKKVDNA